MKKILVLCLLSFSLSYPPTQASSVPDFLESDKPYEGPIFAMGGVYTDLSVSFITTLAAELVSVWGQIEKITSDLQTIDTKKKLQQISMQHPISPLILSRCKRIVAANLPSSFEALPSFVSFKEDTTSQLTSSGELSAKLNIVQLTEASEQRHNKLMAHMEHLKTMLQIQTLIDHLTSEKFVPLPESVAGKKAFNRFRTDYILPLSKMLTGAAESRNAMACALTPLLERLKPLLNKLWNIDIALAEFPVLSYLQAPASAQGYHVPFLQHSAVRNSLDAVELALQQAKYYSYATIFAIGVVFGTSLPFPLPWATSYSAFNWHLSPDAPIGNH